MGHRAVPAYFRQLKSYSKKDAHNACKPKDYTAIHDQVDAADMTITCNCTTDVFPKMLVNPNSVETLDGSYKAIFKVHSIVMTARSDLFRTMGAKMMTADKTIDLGTCSVELASEFVQFLYGFYDNLEGHYDLLPLLDQWQIKDDVLYALCPIISYGHKSLSAAISSIVAMDSHHVLGVDVNKMIEFPHVDTVMKVNPISSIAKDEVTLPPSPKIRVSKILEEDIVTWLVNWTFISTTFGPNTDNVLLLKLPLDIFTEYLRNHYTLAIDYKALRGMVTTYIKSNDLDSWIGQMLKDCAEHIAHIWDQYQHKSESQWLRTFYATEESMRAALRKYRVLKYVCFNDDDEYLASFKWNYKQDGTLRTEHHVRCIGDITFQYNDYTVNKLGYAKLGQSQAQIDEANAVNGE